MNVLSTLAHLVTSAFEFLVVYVGIRYFLVRWIAKRIEKFAHEHPVHYERIEAIFRHYIYNIGHAEKLENCSVGNCKVLS